MEEACEVIKSKIEGYGGTCNIQKAPKVVTAMDDADLAKQLERAEQENAEVSQAFGFMSSLVNGAISELVLLPIFLDDL